MQLADLIWFICLNSGNWQSCSSMPVHSAKLQHTIQVQATKLAYNTNTTYNMIHTIYNDNHTTTTYTLNTHKVKIVTKNNKSLKSRCGSEFHHGSYVMAFCRKWCFENANLHQAIIAKFTEHLVLWVWWRPNWMGVLSKCSRTSIIRTPECHFNVKGVQINEFVRISELSDKMHYLAS